MVAGDKAQCQAAYLAAPGEYIRLHAIPAIGNVPLIKLNAQHLQALYTQKLDEGLSPTTVHHLHAVLHRALNAAMRLGLVQRNVTELVDAPRMARREIETFSPDEARRFLAAAKRERFEALYVLALSTGMRQGELLALRWRDVDLEASTLRVTATLRCSTRQTAMCLLSPRPRTADVWSRCRQSPSMPCVSTRRDRRKNGHA